MSRPAIETERLRLRPFTADDIEAMTPILTDPDVMAYIGAGGPIPAEKVGPMLDHIQRHWEERGFGWWGVELKESGKLIGWCGLKLLNPESGDIELLYLYAKAFWGMGIATEAGDASLRFGFKELGLDRIVAITWPANTASRRVLEKLGMHREKDVRYFNIDMTCYAITRDDYRFQGGAYAVERSAT